MTTKLALSWKHVPAADRTVDPEYMMLHHGEPTGWSVQDGRSYRGGFGVVEQGNDHADGSDDGFWVAHHASHKTLAQAQADVEARFCAKLQ